MSALTTEVALGFAIGALAVPTLSLSADHFGSKVAGAFGGFPATIAASMVLLGFAEGPNQSAAEWSLLLGSPEGRVAAREAVSVVPMMEGFLGIYLTTFAFLARFGRAAALIGAAVPWALLVCGPLFFFSPNITESAVVLLAALVICLWIMEKKLQVELHHGGNVTLTVTDVVLRMLAGGLTVALAVYLGVVSGPIFGGIVASFPAVLASTLAVIYRNSGANAAAGFAKSVMLNALANTGVFSIVAYFTYVPLGLIPATLLGFLATGVSGICCWHAAKAGLN